MVKAKGELEVKSWKIGEVATEYPTKGRSEVSKVMKDEILLAPVSRRSLATLVRAV